MLSEFAVPMLEILTLFALSLVSIPKRKATSVTVTKMLMTIRMMMIHVMALIFESATESDKISASSKKTRHRSLTTFVRTSISRYSRMAT